MTENEYATIVRRYWEDLPHHYHNIELDAFIVMPNHVHGIIVILDDEFIVGARSPRPYTDESGTTKRRLDMDKGATERRPYKKPTLGNIVAYFKYQSAKRINEIRNTPGVSIWQRNYFEHIIRDERSLNRIREYIASNPERWEFDQGNKVRTGEDEFEEWLTSAGRKPVLRR